jgi:hypothetical protein
MDTAPRMTTVRMSPEQLAALPPLATEAPPPFVQTEQHKRELGARLALYRRRRQAAERGEALPPLPWK